ncbi:MAG: beta-lactamase family protein [Rhodanobacteraceae bacterium]|nr:beta-lactamase family protein [Rhodanobacteraceae bacterium]
MRLTGRFSHRGVVCLAAILFAAASSSRAADTCAAAATSDPAAATAQLLLDALIAINGVPGMGAAVYHEGKVAWTGCAGLRDIAAHKPVRRDTVFRLASVSKAVTAVAVARLSEQGKLDLDAPVKTMLPWLVNDWPAISVRQLAAHLSGLPHYQAGDENRGKVHYETSRAAAAVFSNRALLSAPGTAYSYSSWGYTLMGAVIEARSGQHFLDYLRSEVTTDLPIGADPDGRRTDASRLYTMDAGTARELPPHDFSYTWPGGGLAATPEALVRFGARVLDGSIVAPSTWQSMLQPTLLTSGVAAAESDYRVALGWRVAQDADGARIAHHAGVTEGARSALLLWPEQGTVAAVLSNASWVSSIVTTAAVLAAPFRPRPGLTKAECPRDSRRYRGKLGEQTLGGEVTFRLEAGRCVGTLLPDTALEKHFASATAWPAHRLDIIALDVDGRLDRAALVTPFGLYELRADTSDGWSAMLGTRPLQLKFRGAADGRRAKAQSSR